MERLLDLSCDTGSKSPSAITDHSRPPNGLAEADVDWINLMVGQGLTVLLSFSYHVAFASKPSPEGHARSSALVHHNPSLSLKVLS